jgi:hypothetical protein
MDKKGGKLVIPGYIQRKGALGANEAKERWQKIGKRKFYLLKPLKRMLFIKFTTKMPPHFLFKFCTRITFSSLILQEWLPNRSS